MRKQTAVGGKYTEDNERVDEGKMWRALVAFRTRWEAAGSLYGLDVSGMR